MSYLPALCNGCAQSIPNPPLLGSSAGSSPLTSAPNSRPLAMGDWCMRAHKPCSKHP